MPQAALLAAGVGHVPQRFDNLPQAEAALALQGPQWSNNLPLRVGKGLLAKAMCARAYELPP